MKVISTTITITIAIGIFPFFLNTQVYAEDTDHRAEAIQHAEKAIKQGKMGCAEELLIHAKESMEHAQAASNSGADSHMKQAVKHLEGAIRHAEMHRAGAATNHTKTAMSLMQESESTH
ncbi:small metal-binding protein SmbP [Nitrosomonas sp. Nm33]|uniref:small metal-binding protein SmbP n=1 Tax=Nitrosomonas sp. Nm33 TaxID=133724 RepID=UPI00089CA0F9|nr:small metal-binding protein SmbP [Nitrosomonas sp. Nm33]SDY98715.1 Small metal-binding protein [Nitrosomonas sp. Nm33]